MPELTKKLQNQKKTRNFHGLYDFVVIDLTYSSSRTACCRLTRGQVETIFRKGKIRESFEPMKISDLIEVLNHIIPWKNIIEQGTFACYNIKNGSTRYEELKR